MNLPKGDVTTAKDERAWQDDPAALGNRIKFICRRGRECPRTAETMQGGNDDDSLCILAEGFEEVEALTPVDILRRGGVTVKTVGIGGKTITGAHGIPVGCDIAEEDVIPDEIDMMVLPGGMPGTTHLGESLTIQEGLAYAAQEDLWVAAICAAPSVLGENGLLHGRKYTCYPGFENDEKYHGIYTAAPLQQDGKIITANGAGNAMTFALYLLAALQGEEKALEVGRSIQMKL